MNKIQFAIALHFHQPIGNFEHIFKRAYENCYKPFIELLWQRPKLKMTFHISGCLLDYLDRQHPNTIKMLKEMVSRKQIEIMAGGYYEPIITAIPEKDLAGQIGMMRKYIKKRFNIAPTGMWIAERVWDSKLAKLLYKAGIRYIILDDEHLLRSGIKKDNMHGYFLTGHGRERIAVFPSDKGLRYMIPFKQPHEVIDYFGNISSKAKNALFTYGDDGEKFGEWPGTHKWVYEQKWLEKFFNLLEENRYWIEPVHFSKYLKDNKPKAALEIKQGSYEEMMQWSGGNWLNFLSKYPEANHMHRKMYFVSSKADKIKRLGNKKQIELMKRLLYQSQCNCAYWHGVFGGLYLYHLRSAIYRHLIEAEKIADNILYKGKKSWFDKIDNLSILADKDFSICIDGHHGGVIKELDYKPHSFNLVNTISRKKEAYHQRILNSADKSPQAKVATIHDDFRTIDPAFKDMLIYDKFERHFLRSYFVKSDTTLKDFMASLYTELGDFSNNAYALTRNDKGVILQRESRIANKPVEVLKSINIKSSAEGGSACGGKNEIDFSVSVKTKGASGLNALFALEFNVTMPDLNADRYNYFFDGENKKNLNEQGEGFPEFNFGVSDSFDQLGICFDFFKKPKSVLYYPVKTISQSERAYELSYQCSCILFLWSIDSGKDTEYNFDIRLSLRKNNG